MIASVVFDLDGVLLDSEHRWDRVRREVVEEHGRPWPAGATEAMQGMSSIEWSSYLRERIGLDLDRDRITTLVVDKLLEEYAHELPLLPGAREAVRRLAEQWPLGLASSSNRVVIDNVLELAGLKEDFAVTVSSEEVDRGKPSPDVYLEAARQLAVGPHQCCAVEDSANGIRAASAAGMAVVALPNAQAPPDPAALAMAEVVLHELPALTAAVVQRAGERAAERVNHRLDEAEEESFPASDSHIDWAGPPS